MFSGLLVALQGDDEDRGKERNPSTKRQKDREGVLAETANNRVNKEQ